MRIEKEIERAARRQAALDTEEVKTEVQIKSIIESVINSFEDKTYNFGKLDTIILNQNDKKRLVKVYTENYSPENILCKCIKQILDRTFKVKYPNRNKSIKTLFSVISAIKNMSDFTIVKFDFKDYFNSVSSKYVFEKILKHKLLDRFESELVKEFSEAIKYTYAGLSTSNVISKIIAQDFDEAIKKAFLHDGIIFYERYIDDCILVLNKNIDENSIKIILEKIRISIFHDKVAGVAKKCKTKFNPAKFQYLSRRTLTIKISTIDYLGYEFYFKIKQNANINIQFGITTSKRDKYNRRVDELIHLYTDIRSADKGNLELLRHRISAFTKRTVYTTKRFNSTVWKIKGFISNYGELRYMLGTQLIHNDTDSFLKNMVKDAFVRAGIIVPYFLTSTQGEAAYNLFENMKKNRALLFINNIGYDYSSLARLCKKIGIECTTGAGNKRGYGTLVRNYLIKTKVGY